MAIKIYVKIPSLLPSFWIEVWRLQNQGISIWALVLLHFQKPSKWKNGNENVTI